MNGDVGVPLAQQLQRRETAETGHVVVAHDDVPSSAIERARHGRRAVDTQAIETVPGLLELVREEERIVFRVFGEEEPESPWHR